MIRCKSCQLAACTCGKEDWEDYQTGGEAKAELAKLRNELAAAKAEIVRLNDDSMEACSVFTKATAARDLVIKQMREALVTVYGCYPPSYGTGEKCVTAREALGLQPTQEALDAYVKQAVDQERGRLAALLDKRYEECLEPEIKEVADMIRRGG